MQVTKRRFVAGLLPAIGSLLLGIAGPAALAQPAEVTLSAETFARLHKQIRPQAGESRWLEIPWQIDLHVARRQAAAEGKPMFVYSGGGSTGIGAC